MELWVSGYGGDGTRSVARVRITEGCVETLWETQISASSYLSFWNELLFVVSEWKKGSAIQLLFREGEAFQPRDVVEIPGGQLCHITYLSQQKALLGACYGSGEVFSVAVNPESATFGSLLTYRKQGRGTECSAGSTRAHSILANQTETVAIAANIALDRLYLYRIIDGKLEDEHFLQLPKGVGPRHFVWREDIDKIYVVTEYSNEVLVVNADKNNLSLMSRHSTLHNNFAGESYGSTLVFSADGKYLYAGNRGEDSIAVFALKEDGLPVTISRFSCGGCWPRDLALVDEGRYLAVANQKSDCVILLPRDEDTGLLGKPWLSIPLKGASFVRDTTK